MGSPQSEQVGRTSETRLPDLSAMTAALASLKLEERSEMLERLVAAIYEVESGRDTVAVTRELLAWTAHGITSSQPGYAKPEELAGGEWRTVSHEDVLDITKA